MMMRLLRCALLLIVFCASVHAQCSSSPPGIGYYCSSNQVVPCPAGQYCATAGLAAPTNTCTAGYFCAPGSVNAFGANYSAGVTRLFADVSTTFSDSSTALSLPTSSIFDAANNILYVIDNSRILRFGLPGTSGSNLAGYTSSGSSDGTGTNARFNGCSGLVASPSFTYLYAADTWSHTIRQINVATRAVVTVAGNAGTDGNTDGIGNAARFYNPADVAINSAGSYLYVADKFNNRIRRIQTSNFQVTTIAGSTADNAEPDGVGTNALFFQPYGVTMYPNGIFLLVLSRAVRRIELSTGVVTTLTKSGNFESNPGFYRAYATSASIDPTSTFAYLIMQYPDSSAYSQIRQLNLNTGVFRSIGAFFPKNGFSIAPSGLSIDSTGSSLFVSDSNQRTVVQVSLNNQCPAGYYCPTGATAPVVCPLGSYCPLGSASATACTTAGSYCPAGSSAQRPCPGGSYCSSVSAIVQCPAGTYCTAGSTAASNQLTCSSIGAYCAAGSSAQGTCPKGSYCPNAATQNFCPKGMFCASVGYTAPSGNCSAGYLCDSGSINAYGASPNASVVTSEFVRSFIDNTGSSFAQPQGIAAARQFVYVADTMNNVIRFVELASGNVRTLAGNPNSGGNGNNDGTGTLARFYGPTGLVIDSTGQYLYVADSYNHRIRQIQNMTGVVTTIAGSSIGCIDGLGTNAAFRNPRALALDSNNPFLYVADTDNNCIRKVDMTNNNNQVTTLAGNVMSGYSDGFGTNALFDAPTAIAVDPTGNYLVVGDSNNKYVRRIVISTGIVTTMMLSSAFASNPSSPASFSKFTGLVFDLSGSFLFVAEESIITQVAFGSSVSAAKQFGRNNNILAISLDPYTGVNLYASDKVQNKLFQFTPSSPCPSGYSCTQGVATPTLCAIGSYCPAGTSTPSSCSAAGSACCPAGQFLSSGTCQSCSFDSFTSGANTLPYCTSCPAGTRSVNPSGSTACKASSASRHVLSFGAAMITLLFASLI